MRRCKTYKKKDKRIFRNTADKTKAVNLLTPTFMRGGFRL